MNVALKYVLEFLLIWGLPILVIFSCFYCNQYLLGQLKKWPLAWFVIGLVSFLVPLILWLAIPIHYFRTRNNELIGCGGTLFTFFVVFMGFTMLSMVPHHSDTTTLYMNLFLLMYISVPVVFMLQLIRHVFFLKTHKNKFGTDTQDEIEDVERI